MTAEHPYHHGNLRPALLDAATAEIGAVGATAMSLRKVAARAGVTHAAAAHHFGDKRGLLTAVAAEGHRALAEALAAARSEGLVAMGDAYIRFAGEHRPWFEVMFRPELLRDDDPDYVAAAAQSFGALTSTTGRDEGAPRGRRGSGRDAAYGAWALVHGVATLWVTGNLPAASADEAVALFHRAAKSLAGPSRRPS
jgi:AcrR family transcriptional regulator